MIANIRSIIDLVRIPLKIKTIDGIIANDKDLKILFCLKQIAQIEQYDRTRILLIIIYIENAVLLIKPNDKYFILIIINIKEPKRPICSNVSIVLLLYLLIKPSLHFMANIMLGIMIMAINNNPYIFIQMKLLFASNNILFYSFHFSNSIYISIHQMSSY